MIRTNFYDEDDYSAFVMDESRVSTDDREPDEHDPSNLDPDMTIFNTLEDED
jgi:hypothetical protein